MDSTPKEAPPSRGDQAEELLREMTLWPLWIVVMAHVVAFVAPVMLLGFRDGRVSALGVVTIMAAMTGFGMWERIRERRRLGLLEATLLSGWALSVVGAYFADHWGIF